MWSHWIDTRLESNESLKRSAAKKKCVHRKSINILTKDNFNATIASIAEEKLIF